MLGTAQRPRRTFKKGRTEKKKGERDAGKAILV